MSNSSVGFLRLRVVAGVATVFLMGAAHADVKIVSHLQGTSVRKALDETVTAYYKGDFMRSDSKDTSTIFDAKAGKVYILNNTKKTYSELSDNTPNTHGMQVTANATLTPTDEHKDILGHNASKFVCNMHMSMSMGSGQGISMDMEMDFWTTSDLKTPYESAHLLRSMKQMMGGMNVTGMDQVVNEMKKLQGFPLEYTMVMQNIPGMPGGGSGPMVNIDSVATSISEDPLADDMFQVPSDYKKVANEKGGGFGG